MPIGYARVSTDDQNLELQRAALGEAGCMRIYEEKPSGANRNRPELVRLLEHLRGGDVVVVYRLDRLARSTRICSRSQSSSRKLMPACVRYPNPGPTRPRPPAGWC
jgi:DNA invertase Pin-like site-specific DNA recombinase